MNGTYEVLPAGKRGSGYNVYHRNSTRRVWVGFAQTKREADQVRLSRVNGRIRTH